MVRTTLPTKLLLASQVVRAPPVTVRVPTFPEMTLVKVVRSQDPCPAWWWRGSG